MKNIIMLIFSAILISCGTTGFTKKAEGIDYMMVSHGCAGAIYSWFTGDVCYWKATSTKDDIEWSLSVTDKDEWTMTGHTKSYGVLRE